MFSLSKPLSHSKIGALAGLVLAVAAALGTPKSEAAAYAVIVSPDVPVRTLSVADCRRVFLFERTMWKRGLHVTVLLPERGLPARSFLLRRIYRMDDSELRRMILERVFQGRIDFAPKAARSDHEAVRFVALAHGLIALVPADTPGLHEVQVVRVEGKLPGDPGYPLRD